MDSQVGFGKAQSLVEVTERQGHLLYATVRVNDVAVREAMRRIVSSDGSPLTSL